MPSRFLSTCVLTSAALLALDRIEAQPVAVWPAPGARVHLHAHNCYPDAGRWSDRLDRALAAGAPHLAIEQDLVWIPPGNGQPGRSVVAHDAPAQGDEPRLDDHFFARIRPQMEAALREQDTAAWPLLVLHLDFKTNEPEHHQYIWDLLGRHEAWLTTAIRTPGGSAPSPLRVGPLLVLTENGDGQEWAFHLTHAVGTPLRLFGTVPPAEVDLPDDERARAALLVGRRPDELVPAGATSYRRWTNQPWTTVEQGGAPGAGAWTPTDEARLRTLVARAHGMGLWVRFYGLNGHDVGDMGWSAGYNFGTLESARLRWQALIAARADFVATDQYEAFATELRAQRSPRAR